MYAFAELCMWKTNLQKTQKHHKEEEGGGEVQQSQKLSGLKGTPSTHLSVKEYTYKKIKATQNYIETYNGAFSF